MSGRYTITFSGLKEGHHGFNFEISDKFFESFEDSEIKEGSLFASVDLEKRPSHLDLMITIAGKVKVSCDRCLGMFYFPVECRNRLLIKFGSNVGEDDPDIISMPSDEHDVDLQQHFYEFISLALPIRRVHPVDENGKSTCDPEMLKKLNDHIVDEEGDNDPRWDELKKLMNNN